MNNSESDDGMVHKEERAFARRQGNGTYGHNFVLGLRFVARSTDAALVLAVIMFLTEMASYDYEQVDRYEQTSIRTLGYILLHSEKGKGLHLVDYEEVAAPIRLAATHGSAIAQETAGKILRRKEVSMDGDYFMPRY